MNPRRMKPCGERRAKRDVPYRGRIAPSPTGYLHLGHAATFWTAYRRARAAEGTVILRNEDLDRARCQPEFVEAMLEDLRWLGLQWDEGPDVGGPHEPYDQSKRIPLYRQALERLKQAGVVYACTCSRRDILAAAGAPHAGEEEAVYPGTCRSAGLEASSPNVCWRFRVPDGEQVDFQDEQMGPCSFVAGKDFGDFVIWRREDLPSYQLAVTLDDAAMGITEVVRGEDLLLSTARQILLYRALGSEAPAFYHCPLVRDENGDRLAKRHDALSIRSLRAAGRRPEDLLQAFAG